MTNMCWDWIYGEYTGGFPAFAPLVEHLRESYGRASLLLRLPMHGDLNAFPCWRDIPLVARRATVAADDVRGRLELPRCDPVVLLSFGGLGLALDAAPTMRGVTFLSTAAARGGDTPRGVRTIT